MVPVERLRAAGADERRIARAQEREERGETLPEFGSLTDRDIHDWLTGTVAQPVEKSSRDLLVHATPVYGRQPPVELDQVPRERLALQCHATEGQVAQIVAEFRRYPLSTGDFAAFFLRRCTPDVVRWLEVQQECVPHFTPPCEPMMEEVQALLDEEMCGTSPPSEHRYPSTGLYPSPLIFPH